MTIEDPNPRTASPALVQAVTRRLLERHPEWTPEERAGRAKYLAEHAAVGIDHRGIAFVQSSKVDIVKGCAPRLLDDEPLAGGKTKIARAKQLESIYRGRLLAARHAPPARLEPISQRLAAAVAEDPALQGSTSAAKSARARVRERLVAETMAAAGRPMGRLNSNGVNE